MLHFLVSVTAFLVNAALPGEHYSISAKCCTSWWALQHFCQMLHFLVSITSFLPNVALPGEHYIISAKCGTSWWTLHDFCQMLHFLVSITAFLPNVALSWVLPQLCSSQPSTLVSNESLLTTFLWVEWLDDWKEEDVWKYPGVENGSIRANRTSQSTGLYSNCPGFKYCPWCQLFLLLIFMIFLWVRTGIFLHNAPN
jgi:hypothetical protein